MASNGLRGHGGHLYNQNLTLVFWPNIFYLLYVLSSFLPILFIQCQSKVLIDPVSKTNHELIAPLSSLSMVRIAGEYRIL